jgi:hypothetical protein
MALGVAQRLVGTDLPRCQPSLRRAPRLAPGNTYFGGGDRSGLWTEHAAQPRNRDVHGSEMSPRMPGFTACQENLGGGGLGGGAGSRVERVSGSKNREFPAFRCENRGSARVFARRRHESFRCFNSLGPQDRRSCYSTKQGCLTPVSGTESAAAGCALSPIRRKSLGPGAAAPTVHRPVICAVDVLFCSGFSPGHANASRTPGYPPAGRGL